jgi:Fur family ferric uptake transcriptional regulator
MPGCDYYRWDCGSRLGDEIEVISNNSQGQMAIAADYKRYVLGRGFAQKILVEPVKD